MPDNTKANQDLIDPADFRSFELGISFENETTRTAVKDGKRIYGEKKSKDTEELAVLLLEFTQNGFVLEVPAHTCAEGHRLKMVIRVKSLPVSKKYPKGILEFKAGVRVEESERLENKRDRITVDLVDFEEAIWIEFQEIYARRQKQILEFFEAVKP